MKIGLYLLVLSPLLIGLRANALTIDTPKEPHNFIGVEGQIDSYPISSVQDLIDFAALVNSGNTNISGYLTCSIDFRELGLDANDSNFTPIGSYTASENRSFQGSFDGCGYTIKGLIINNRTSDYQGLFGVADGATIQNVCLTGGSISGNNYVGGVCGQLINSTLQNCINTGNVTANDSAGGICGYISNSNIECCINAGKIKAENECGGICSNSTDQSVVKDCLNIGYVKSVNGNNGSIFYSCSPDSTYTYCYNDQQLCPLPYPNGSGVRGVEVKNKLTTEMVGESLNVTPNRSNWVYSDNMYPRPAAIADSDVAIVAATPVFLDAGDSVIPITFDTSTSVTKASRVNTDNGVNWSITSTSGFKLTDYFISVLQSNAEATLTVSKNNATKSITLESNSSISSYGSEPNPFIISNATDLESFATAYNSNTSYVSVLSSSSISCYCILTRDINLSSICYRVDGTTALDRSWTPIGNSSRKFTGTFDGNGHTISNLYINSTASNQGLFGYCDNAIIQNLQVENAYVKGNETVGGICGWSDSSTIKQCSYNGTVISTSIAGSICGYNYNLSSIEDCAGFGEVCGNGTVGGICGSNRSSYIGTCYFSGTISGTSYIGSICGLNNGTVSYCYYNSDKSSIGAVNSTDIANTAGLVLTNMTSSDAITNMAGFNADNQHLFWQAPPSPIIGENSTVFFYPQLKVFLSSPVQNSDFVSETLYNLTGSVGITGTGEFGSTLTATVTESNNTGVLSYQWKRGGANIGSNRTSSNQYTLVQEDIGQTITCEVFSTKEISSITGTYSQVIMKAQQIPPSSLTSTDPYYQGGSDGVILNTDSSMQWCTVANFTQTIHQCEGTTITGLSAGNYYVRYKEDTTHQASLPVPITINDGVVIPAPAPNNNQDPANFTTPKPIVTNPLPCSLGEKNSGTLCYIQEQGLACKIVLQNATPIGYIQAFTFNIALEKDNYKTNYNSKNGLFQFTYPSEYWKIGRSYALIGVNKNGIPKIFYDEDTSDETVTVNLDIEGYAFSLIYSDIGV